MDCPVVMISKLPEPADLEENKRPEITDLRIPDFTAQYADVILFMYREQGNGRKSEAADQFDRYHYSQEPLRQRWGDKA